MDVYDGIDCVCMMWMYRSDYTDPERQNRLFRMRAPANSKDICSMYYT